MMVVVVVMVMVRVIVRVRVRNGGEVNVRVSGVVMFTVRAIDRA